MQTFPFGLGFTADLSDLLCMNSKEDGGLTRGECYSALVLHEIVKEDDLFISRFQCDSLFTPEHCLDILR
jgi:hypothetical protein